MRNTTHMMISQADALPPPANTNEGTWSLPGGIIGFVAWLLALAIPFLLYGPNTLFFFLYTWPFFLALMPVAIVVGIAVHSLLQGRLLLSCPVTLLTVMVMFGALFLWLLS